MVGEVRDHIVVFEALLVELEVSTEDILADPQLTIGRKRLAI